MATVTQVHVLFLFHLSIYLFIYLFIFIYFTLMAITELCDGHNNDKKGPQGRFVKQLQRSHIKTNHLIEKSFFRLSF